MSYSVAIVGALLLQSVSSQNGRNHGALPTGELRGGHLASCGKMRDVLFISAVVFNESLPRLGAHHECLPGNQVSLHNPSVTL